MKTEAYQGQGLILAVYPNLVSAAFQNKQITLSRQPGKEILVGDLVDLHNEKITRIHPRRNHFSRRAPAARPGGRCKEQKMAANVDQVMAVLAAERPAPKWKLLDRYLAAAEAADLPAVICITKTDLLHDTNRQSLQRALEIYRRMDYPVFFTSTLTGEGMSDISAAIAGRTSIMIGKSGVGKSSLMNQLAPQAQRSTGNVGMESGKGRHTTSSAWLQTLEDGGALIDMPGTREFGLWFGEDDLAYIFRDLRPYLGTCRFGLDCRHDEEPGCAVREAVMTGNIHPWRYQSYLRLLDEEAGR